MVANAGVQSDFPSVVAGDWLTWFGIGEAIGTCTGVGELSKAKVSIDHCIRSIGAGVWANTVPAAKPSRTRISPSGLETALDVFVIETCLDVRLTVLVSTNSDGRTGKPQGSMYTPTTQGALVQHRLRPKIQRQESACEIATQRSR